MNVVSNPNADVVSSPVELRSDQHHADGIKDTLESIIVALILAFVFRAFIVEAFVIPTGSMAPTLYGAHGRIVCEECGTEFAYGLRDLDDTRLSHPVRSTSTVVCPNCGHANTDLVVSDDHLNAEKGDRILVLKWPLDIGGPWFSPARWDVTVFKDPSDGVTNFIKRLVGLPNEVLQIVDGDVYTVPTSELSSEALQVLDALRHEKYELRIGERLGRLGSPPAWVLGELDAKMKIARKTPVAQKSLWSTVYHNDYPPRHHDSGEPQWLAPAAERSGWNAENRIIRFKDQGLPDDHIELVGGRFAAKSAYNVYEGPAPPVSDHRVSFVIIPAASQGNVAIRLTKLGRSFWARIDMNGSVSIEEERSAKTPGEPVRMSAKLAPFVPGHASQIAFENVDYRLALSVDQKEVLASSDDPTSPAFYGPNLAELRSNRLVQPVVPPWISAAGGDFELRHVSVQRDEHYFNDPRVNSALALPWAPREGWASPRNPILLREGEYFMLGDNTAASKDSRLWDKVGPHLVGRGEEFQLGTVPEDQLIGKAFFVYWPAGHRVSWLPILKNFGIIPDVGRMRWIR